MAPVNITNPDLTKGDDITKSLVGGVTPFLALLGQGFTNTFLSQSISVCDWIVFACVPTGVPFALTAIIRVSRRNGFLRGLFTYPEEENRFIERDLLSSTSEEVCEIWNGRGVTRQFAPLSQLPVTEWIFDGTLMRSAEAKNHILFKKEEMDIAAPLSPLKGENHEFNYWQEKAETELPPNLIMNLGPYNRARILYFLTVIGLFLQLGIMTLAGLTAFRWREKFFTKSTKADTIIAPTLVWTGTVMLSFGLLYTAKTIDTSARVDVWKPAKQGMMVIWRQDNHESEDMHTECYVIGKVIKSELISSHRRLQNRPSTSWSLPVALAISTGFLVQSVGVSLMHWPTQTLQFLSMIFMFLGRCYARKQDPPDFVQKLDQTITDEELLEIAQRWHREKLRSE